MKAERIANHLTVDLDVARKVLALMRGHASPFDVGETAKWADQCYHAPSETSPETIMHAINATIGGFGSEAIYGADALHPVAEYINTGHTYGATILYDYVRERYCLTTVGDWIERYGDQLGVQ